MYCTLFLHGVAALAPAAHLPVWRLLIIVELHLEKVGLDLTWVLCSHIVDRLAQTTSQ
jgi:hypothetical protein